MIAILFIALFATVAVASVVTLADAVVRGRAVVRQVRGELARCEAIRMVKVTFEGVEGPPRMPVLRSASVSAGRSSQRRMAPARAQQRAAA